MVNPKAVHAANALNPEAIQDELINELKEGHVLHTMIQEHAVILGLLDELEQINKKTQEMQQYDKDAAWFKRLYHIIKHLENAESHHQREEQILYPELEKRGVLGPIEVMLGEHEHIRNLKDELNSIYESIDQNSFEVFKKKISHISDRLVAGLRDHIYKENNVLYPAALSIIQDENVWADMKKACDKIGYCCFTPTH